MKQCVKFPEDKFLAVRTCLVAICMGNRPAANLLSILLFRYNLRMENKDDAENQNAVKAAKGESPDQDTSVRIFRTQAQLVEDMCGEITEKTLHDTAVPMLQLLGFLELEEHMIANCYILHVDLVQQALNLYLPGVKDQPQLEKFLISTMQLEKFLITSDELEKFLIDKKNFLSGLEKVLIQNRKISNYRRGRKLAPGAARRAKSHPPKNLEESNKKDIEEEREGVSANASTPHAPAYYQNLPIPVTYAEALAYLVPHGPHEGLDAVEVVKLAQKLWTEAHESSSHSHAATGKPEDEDDTPTDGNMPAITTGKQFKRVVKGATNDTPTIGNISHPYGSSSADLSASSVYQRAQERSLEPKGITDASTDTPQPDMAIHPDDDSSRHNSSTLRDFPDMARGEASVKPKGVTDGQSEHRPDHHGDDPDTGLHSSNHSGRPVPLHLPIEHTTSPARDGDHEHTDGAATVLSGGEPRQSGGNVTQEKPKRSRKQPFEFTAHEQEMKTWYEELRDTTVDPNNKRDRAALQGLGQKKGAAGGPVTKEDLLNVTAILDVDKWFEDHKVGVDLYWINYHWNNKIIFMRRKKAAPPPAEKTPYNSIETALAIKRGTHQQKVQGSHD